MVSLDIHVTNTNINVEKMTLKYVDQVVCDNYNVWMHVHGLITKSFDRKMCGIACQLF